MPPLSGRMEEMGSKRSSSSTKGPKGDSAKGGNKPGKVYPDVPSTPKAESPGRLRLAALESGFRLSRRKWPPCSRVSRDAQPPDTKAGGSRHCDGGAHGGEICPSRELEDPLASQQPFTGLLGPLALPLIGRAPGCDLSDPSHVMELRGTTSHTATAMDPVHGSQWSVSSTDITLTAQQGAVLRSSYGSDGMGEVSTGTASMAFTGQRSQPMDAAGQLLLVDDSALSGHSALPGQSSHSAAVHGDTPMEVARDTFRVSLACPGPSLFSRDLGHPRDSPALLWGPGNFQGSGQTPAIRQAPPLDFGGIRPLPNRTTATMTSVTAPAVTMASYGGVSTSTSLGRPISSLGIAQNNQVSAPSGQPQQQWSRDMPQGVQLPYTQGTSEIPMEQALNRVFPRGIPAAMEQYLAPAMEPDISSFRRQSGQSPLDSVISLQELRSDVMARYPGYQVEPSEPAPTTPTSLGLANFQQPNPEKEANLPLSRGLAHMSGTNSRGERPAWESHKAPSRAKDLSQTTVLEGRTFRAFKCPLFIEGRPTPSGVEQIGLRPGQDLP